MKKLNLIIAFLLLVTFGLHAQNRLVFGLEFDSTWNCVEVSFNNGKVTGNWKKSKLIGKNQFGFPDFDVEHGVDYKFTGSQVLAASKGERKFDIKFQSPDGPYYALTTNSKDIWTIRQKDKYTFILEIPTLLITPSGQVSKRVLKMEEQPEGG